MDAATDDSWPVWCRYCSKKFDSHDSYADSYEMLDSHIERDHPEKNSR